METKKRWEPAQPEPDEALIRAIWDEDAAAVSAALAAGASVWAFDPCNRDTAIIVAAKFDSMAQIIPILLRAGANLEARDWFWGNTPLIFAAIRLPVKALKVLIDAGGNMEAHNNDEETALHCCAERGNLSAVRLLIGSGAVVDSTTDYGETPLFYAIENNQLNVVTHLIGFGANPVARNVHDSSPLHRAASCGNAAAATAILETGASADAADSDGETPLHEAIGALNQIEFDELVVAAKAAPGRNGRSRFPRAALEMAARVVSPVDRQRVIRMLETCNRDCDGPTSAENCARALATINVLLAAGASPLACNINGESPLAIARSRGLVGAVPVLESSAGALQAESPDADASSTQSGIDKVLIDAIRAGGGSAVGAALAAGASVEARYPGHSEPALSVAAHAPNAAKTIPILLAAGADRDSHDEELGSTPLMWATGRDAWEALELLIAAGCDLNATNIRGETALYLCVRRGNLAALSKLIEAGANLDAADADQETPLNKSVTLGYAAITTALITAGADVNVGDKIGSTPLHRAATRGNAQLTLELLTAGANPDQRRSDGYAPLHEVLNTCIYCASGSAEWLCSRHLATIRELLAGGASPVLEDPRGYKPIDYAIDAKFTEAQTILEDAIRNWKG